ncbi:MAG: transposase [Carnobacterium sp.]
MILQNSNTLDFKHYSCQSLFKSYLATTDVVDYLLALDEELKATYLYYQDLFYAFKTADYASFENVLNTVPPKISNEMKKSVNTLKKHKNHIANTFQSPHLNGPIEGTITKIKVLNRIAFGYRSFSSVKRRILLACRTTQKAA